jgi:UDP-sulfoquinovose synthase
MTETYKVKGLAELIAKLYGTKVEYVENLRKEAVENDLVVENKQFLALGLNPTTLSNGLLEEIEEIAKKYAARIDKTKIPATSLWVAQKTKK